MKRILVALDASPRAPHVLDAAIALAKQSNAPLDLYRAVTIPPELPLDRYMATSGNLAELLTGDARENLAAFAKKVPPELLGEVCVKIAAPWEGICRFAHEKGANVIVIGSHGYGMIDRVLGTTAAKVVNHAECSVFVVR